MPGRDFVLGDYVDVDMTNLSNPELKFKGKARIVVGMTLTLYLGRLLRLSLSLSLED